MKQIRIQFLLFTIICFLSSCAIDEFYCSRDFTDSKPIYTVPSREISNYSNASPNFELTFNPLVLPAKIKYNTKDGFYIEGKNDVSIILPIGTFSIDYGVGLIQGMEIDGNKITSGDYIIALINKRKNTKEIFAIKNQSRLKATINGTTIIDARLGYMEIDVTNAQIKEIKFIDNSKISIVNMSKYVARFVFFTINPKTNTAVQTKLCEVAPKSYKNLRGWVGDSKSLNESSLVRYEIALPLSGNNETYTQPISIRYGEPCIINYDSKNKKFYIETKNE